MGIYDRDYERSYDTGSGWRDGGGGGVGTGLGGWSANAKLLLAIVVVYVLQLVFMQPDKTSPVTELLELPGGWLLQPWRAYGLVTYALVHDTRGVQHVLFNGLAIFFFGRVIEGRLGGREYLGFFFAGAAFAGLSWSLAEVFAAGGLSEGLPGLVGASGGIAAVLVAFALWYPNVQVYVMGVLPVPAWAMAVLFLAQDIFGALSRSGDTAYTAHLGGALFGFLYHRFGWRVTNWLPSALGGAGGGGPSVGGFKALLKSKPKLRVHREDDEPASPADDRVDEILRKIQAKGQSSLSAEEQRVLERASRRYQRQRKR